MTNPLLPPQSPPHDAAGIYSFCPMNAITLSYELFPACLLHLGIESVLRMDVHQEKNHFQYNSIPLSGSHPSDSSGSTLGLVMLIRVTNQPIHLPSRRSVRSLSSPPPAVVPVDLVFVLYRSLFRNHQPDGTPFKVCGIAAPWRALAEDHRYLALAELREGTASWAPLSLARVTQRQGGLFIRVLECLFG